MARPAFGFSWLGSRVRFVTRPICVSSQMDQAWPVRKYTSAEWPKSPVKTRILASFRKLECKWWFSSCQDFSFDNLRLIWILDHTRHRQIIYVFHLIWIPKLQAWFQIDFIILSYKKQTMPKRLSNLQGRCECENVCPFCQNHVVLVHSMIQSDLIDH